MRLFFILGWALLLLAFAGAAAEVLPRTLPGGGGVFVSAHELWYAVWPGSLVVSQIQVERISPTLWELLRVSILALPVWLLFGLPGGALVWFFNPHKQMTRHQREELERQEEALVLYDKLAQEAKEAGFDDSEDDQLPIHNDNLLIDVPGFSGPQTDAASSIGEDGWGDIEEGGWDGIEDGDGEIGDGGGEK